MFNLDYLKRISNIFFYTDERVKCLVKTSKKKLNDNESFIEAVLQWILQR